ncbi:MAG TPA: SgcJ/EcaC family oxidoreductase [Pseudonocardiaceae bacterium]|jgi:uncharacterized protein (TIGR02246 family)
MTNTLMSTDEQVRTVIAKASAGWTANDADAIAALYTEDAAAVLAGGVFLRDRTAIRDRLAWGFAGPTKGSTMTDQVESVRFVGDQVAIVITVGGFRFPGETELPAGRGRRTTWVLAGQNEVWLVKSFHNVPTD